MRTGRKKQSGHDGAVPSIRSADVRARLRTRSLKRSRCNNTQRVSTSGAHGIVNTPEMMRTSETVTPQVRACSAAPTPGFPPPRPARRSRRRAIAGGRRCMSPGSRLAAWPRTKRTSGLNAHYPPRALATEFGLLRVAAGLPDRSRRLEDATLCPRKGGTGVTGRPESVSMSYLPHLVPRPQHENELTGLGG
jgi:hypothetical protein